MDSKPADFFIGVMEFFSILLPGALLTYLLLPFGIDLVAPVFPIPEDRVEQWIAFLIVAYVLGHVLHHLGSLLDEIYDKDYAEQHRSPGDKELLTRAKARMKKQLGDTGEKLSAFSWAGAYVRVHSAPAANEIERSGADSKFFRSLTPVLFVGTILALVQGALALCAILLLAMNFAFWRFCTRRLATSTLTYEYYALLTRCADVGCCHAEAHRHCHVQTPPPQAPA